MLNRLLLPALAATALGLSACGSDDASTASSDATTPAAAASAAATSTGADSSTDATADAADATADSTPAKQSPGAFDASDGAVTIKATEFAFSPSVITARAGKLKITMENAGDTVHELVVLKTGAAPGSLEVTDGRVSEDDSVGEISETDGGASKSHTFDLKAGRYVIVCNVNGHYMKGMYGELVVS